jgi:hypothetical protein
MYIHVLDGKPVVEVVVADSEAASRLCDFLREAEAAIRERYEQQMDYERQQTLSDF